MARVEDEESALCDPFVVKRHQKASQSGPEADNLCPSALHFRSFGWSIYELLAPAVDEDE